MVTIPATATVGDAMGKAVDAGLSRPPVLEPTIDETPAWPMPGTCCAASMTSGAVRRLLRPAHFVPETNASHEC